MLETKGLKAKEERVRDFVVDFSGRRNEYINNGEGIRIMEVPNHFKKIVAREISNYLAAVSRQWDTTFREDVNTKVLAQHLNMKFPEFQAQGVGFVTTHSQSPFDIVSYGANVIIELKSVKEGTKDLVANATLYPDKLAAGEVLAKKLAAGHEDTVLDVLVACVTHKNEVVTGYAIVDGSYWGVTQELYQACRDYFSDLNEIAPEINEILSKRNLFARYLYDGTLGDGVKMTLRKLITLTNPVGRLNVLGHWGISSQG